jgi:hypothetical protein
MGRVRITRPFVLLALAALLAPHVEASRTSARESNPPASLTATNADAAAALASLVPAAAAAADVDAAELPAFDLGDVVLVDPADADAEHFHFGPLTLVDLNLLRGPPPSYPETRVRGFELLPPFRVGASPALSLWSRRACGFSCRGVASDSRYDPWGLCAFGLPCPGWAQGAIDSVKEGFGAAGRTAAAGAERWGEELGGVAQYYDTMGRETAQAAKMAVAGKEESAGYTSAQKDWAARTLLGNFLQLWGLAEAATAPSSRARSGRPTARPPASPEVGAPGPSRLGPSDFGLRSIVEDPKLHGMWEDAMRGAASSSRENAYQRYLRSLEKGLTPSKVEARAAFDTVRERFSEAAREAGYSQDLLHHWNWPIGRFPDQAVDPRHLFPSSEATHKAVHRATTSGHPTRSPIDPNHVLPLDPSYPLAPKR